MKTITYKRVSVGCLVNGTLVRANHLDIERVGESKSDARKALKKDLLVLARKVDEALNQVESDIIKEEEA